MTPEHRTDRIRWIEAEQVRRDAIVQHHDSAAVGAARLRILNREAEIARGDKARHG